MNVRTFIDRPILAGVISVIIVIVGFICLSQLPLEQFPEIAPPTVRVSATYTGANAETLQKCVITPLEEAINGVDDMIYMTSTATNTGSATISVVFKQGTDPDMAMVNVQNRVSSATGLLPAEVVKSGVTVRRRQSGNIKMLTLYSPDSTYTSNFLTNYMKINIEPRLSRIEGVGDVSIWGANYSMRIWLDPARMSQYGLVPDDITKVLDEQNIESPTGILGKDSPNTFQYVLKYRGRHELEEDFERMVIRVLPDGSVLRVGDVATVELGSLNYDMISRTAGAPGANAMIAQMDGSNANEVIISIDKITEEISQDLPRGMVLTDIMSVKDFLDASIASVIETLVIAVILVVLVVYMFLHSLRATLIPTIAILVSLVGTFTFMYAVGFSLNMLTLFALVLVIGTVVDDSIVVVEAVQARFDEGYDEPYRAAVDAMGGLSTALVTTSIVFMAVFIPVSFMGGTSGIFYTQFGLTMAVAVAISLLNALTLAPALAALMMRKKRDGAGGRPRAPHPRLGRKFANAFDSAFTSCSTLYVRLITRTFRRKWIVAVLVVAAIAALGYMVANTRTGLVPQEDLGTISINVQCAPGTNLAETDRVVREVEDAIKTMPYVKIYNMVTGNSARFEQSAASGAFTLRLVPWGERDVRGGDQTSLIDSIYARTAHIKDATIRVSTRPMISGYGATSGFELYVQDRKGATVNDLLDVTNDFIDRLNERLEISRAYTTFDTKFPQYIVDVDAVACKRNNVSPADVLSALSGYIGGNYASNINRFTKLYRVMVQAAPEYRLDQASLANLYVRTSDGRMSPLSQYVTLTRVYGSETLTHFNLFPAISVYGQPADGYSSGQAIKAIQETAREWLPVGYGYEFSGMSREESTVGGNTVVLIFVICIVFVYLILCALYESLFMPFAVLLSVPFGLFGSFLFTGIAGLENNVYMQTGLIMLIGLLAKTAILLTEYATARRRAGMSLSMAAVSAARARFRPILMTSFTMIFGMLPLAFASGVGAVANRSVGVGIVGGMLIGTVFLLIVVPPMFIACQWLDERLPLRPRRSKTSLSD